VSSKYVGGVGISSTGEYPVTLAILSLTSAHRGEIISLQSLLLTKPFILRVPVAADFVLFVVEVLLLLLGDGDGGENDTEIVHLIGILPLEVPEHPEEYLIV
jgi:hypothetical protein